VVHRDIKPANILVREDGTVKLADLGIARAMDATQITAEGKVIGTVPYMAPERFRAAGAGGPASDVYALAAVAYELLSGSSLEEPSAGHAEPPDRQRLAAGWPRAPSSVFAVILRGLSEDPERRQRSAGQLVSELQEAVRRGEDTRAFAADRTTRPMLSRSPDLSRPRRSRAGAALVLVLVVLAGLAAAGIALVGGGSGDKSPKKAKTAAKNRVGGSGSASQAASGRESAGSATTAPASDQPAPSSSSADGVSLNAQGFALINEGRPAEAVPILRQAVGSFPEGSTDINYAYALYNLGNALRLSGHPDEAVPVLEERLRIPDQRATVAAELARARAEASAG
jgi:serine/threonine protein kinase